MNPVRAAIVAVLVVVATSVAVGATAPTETPTPDAAEPPLGAQVSAVMQANAGQAHGVVENGMWGAAFADAAGEPAKRALVERRIEALDRSLAELKDQRRALREARRNGNITQEEYRIRMAALVGQLAAVGDGIEETDERARAVGVNTVQLDELRTRARVLGGQEVSYIARNLSGNGDPPGQSGVFGADGPGQSGERGQGPPEEPGSGQPTETPTESEG